MAEGNRRQVLYERVSARAEMLGRVCENIHNTMNLVDDRFLAYSNDAHLMERIYWDNGNDRDPFYDNEVKWIGIFDHRGGHLPRSPASAFVRSRELKKEEFELALNNAIEYYEVRFLREGNLSGNEYIPPEISYLKSVLREHEATPYANLPILERQRNESRDISVAEWEAYKKEHLNDEVEARE